MDGMTGLFSSSTNSAPTVQEIMDAIKRAEEMMNALRPTAEVRYWNWLFHPPVHHPLAYLQLPFGAVGECNDPYLVRTNDEPEQPE